MKIRPLILTFLLFSTFNLYSQKLEFKNNGDKSAFEFFQTFYKKKIYEKENMKIKIEENVILYKVDGIDFMLSFDSNIEKKYIEILSSGLINPFDFYQGTNMKILYIEEISFLNPNPQTKRYRIWIIPTASENPLTNTINPSEFYFELQNKKSNMNTTLSKFLKNGKLTFFQFSTIIL